MRVKSGVAVAHPFSLKSRPHARQRCPRRIAQRRQHQRHSCLEHSLASKALFCPPRGRHRALPPPMPARTTPLAKAQHPGRWLTLGDVFNYVHHHMRAPTSARPQRASFPSYGAQCGPRVVPPRSEGSCQPAFALQTSPMRLQVPCRRSAVWAFAAPPGFSVWGTHYTAPTTPEC